MQHRLPAYALSLATLLAACGEPDPMMMMMPPPATIAEGADVTVARVYESTTHLSAWGGGERPWIPIDLAESHDGQLWVVQRAGRLGDFDDETECTSDVERGLPHDCGSLEGSTVAIAAPATPGLANDGRANLVVDANAFHFMRRPVGIAFGAEQTVLPTTDPGAVDPATGQPLAGAPIVYANLFATCAEHWTGNYTDAPPFVGPTLWTADPAIYDGVNGSYSWSNGSHLDMVHSTEYCMGIAWERDNVYWVFNGDSGALDRYDFAAPHHEGHSYHDDAEVRRYELPTSPLARRENVPSNMMMSGTSLYIADTGNGRVVRFDTTQPATLFGNFFTHENLSAQLYDGTSVAPVVTREALAAEWGAAVEPSGLAFLDEHLVVANHASGHVSLFTMDGVLVRTFDTGLGAGIGGLTVVDGTIYFAHMTERAIYRVDVVQPAPTPEG